MALRTDVVDGRLQGLAMALGLGRRYHDLREGLRARKHNIDTTEMRARKAIFVHVPKCAGSSIAGQMRIAAWHFSASALRAHDPALWEEAFTFGFVRDPFDRMASAFHYFRTTGIHPRDASWGQMALSEFPDFQSFAAALERPAVRRAIMGWPHFVPMTYYLCDRNDRPMVDFVGRTEAFAEGIAVINAASGLGLEARHANRSAKPQDRPLYDSRTARLVADLYAADFATFGYAADRFG